MHILRLLIYIITSQETICFGNQISTNTICYFAKHNKPFSEVLEGSPPCLQRMASAILSFSVLLKRHLIRQVLVPFPYKSAFLHPSCRCIPQRHTSGRFDVCLCLCLPIPTRVGKSYLFSSSCTRSAFRMPGTACSINVL